MADKDPCREAPTGSSATSEVSRALALGRQALYKLLSRFRNEWQSEGMPEGEVAALLELLTQEPDPLVRSQVGAFLGHMLPLFPTTLRRSVGRVLVGLGTDRECIVQRIGLDACSILISDVALRHLAIDQLRQIPTPVPESVADRYFGAIRRVVERFSDDEELAARLEEGSRSPSPFISGLAHFHLALLDLANAVHPHKDPSLDLLDAVTIRLRFAQERRGAEPRIRFLDAVLTLLRRSLSEYPISAIPTNAELFQAARESLAALVQDDFDTWSSVSQEVETLDAVLRRMKQVFTLLEDLSELPTSDQFGTDFAAAITLAHDIVDEAGRSGMAIAPGAAEILVGGTAVALLTKRLLLPTQAERLHERDPSTHTRLKRYLARVGTPANLPIDIINLFDTTPDPLAEVEQARQDLLHRIDSYRNPALADLRNHVAALSADQLTVAEFARIERTIWVQPFNRFAVPSRTYLGGHPGAEEAVGRVMNDLDAAIPAYPGDRRELFQHLLAILVNYIYTSWHNPRWLHLRCEDEIWVPTLDRDLKGLGEQVPEKVFQADLHEHLLARTDIGHVITKEDPDAGSRIDFQGRFATATFPIEAKVVKAAPTRTSVRKRSLAQAQGYTVPHDQIGFHVLLEVSQKPKRTIEPNLSECVWWDTATSPEAKSTGGIAVIVCYGNRWKEQSKRSTYG